MEPEYWTNAICIEKSTRGPIFQRHLESCSCHSDSYRQIFKEPKHPVYGGLLKDTDHLFYIPKWTSLESLVQQGGSEPPWGPTGDALVMGPRGRRCGHPRTLRLAQAGPATTSEGRSIPAAAGRQPTQHPPHPAPPAPRGWEGYGDHRPESTVFAKGVTFVIWPQYDFPL